MKKIVIGCGLVFLIIALLFVGLSFAYKGITENNLENRLETVHNNWIELLELQDEKK